MYNLCLILKDPLLWSTNLVGFATDMTLTATRVMSYHVSFDDVRMLSREMTDSTDVSGMNLLGKNQD